jgi:hypothetical protein
VKLSYDGTVIGTTTGDITPNRVADGGQFDLGSKSTTGANTSTATATVRSFNSSGGVTASTSGADANRILLGTFSFSGLAVGSTAVLTADPGTGNDNVLADGTALDLLIANSNAAVTVTAVPEPGTLALTGLFAAGLAVAGYRRWRRKAA